MNEERLVDIETKLAYQEDLIDSLNTVVSNQQRQVDELEGVCRKLVDKVMELSEELATNRVEDAPPPHY